MEQASQDALTASVDKDTWTAEDYQELLKELFSTSNPADRFKSILAEMEAANPDAKGAVALKIGIARYILCRFADALSAFAEATDNRDCHYFQAQCYKQLRSYEKAVEELDRAEARGWDADAIGLEKAEIWILAGETQNASKAISSLERKLGETAGFKYVRGLLLEMTGCGEEAAQMYVQALEIEEDHPAALFRLAYLHDLHGDEEEAIELYKKCVAQPPVHTNALINLAVLHEDAGRYDMAATCLRRVLATCPAHPRARLFLKDAEASKTMYYDEDQAKRLARRNAVLDIPVTDFELSVRARNCLKKMNIRTLGDLVRTTEVDLLGYKNFGETSLKEIKDMLDSKTLHLGQAMEESDPEYQLVSSQPAGVENEGILATPLEQVELSIRARRALQALHIGTLGELASKTEQELMVCKNFGQTSLNEVRQRLAEYGLALRETNN